MYVFSLIHNLWKAMQQRKFKIFIKLLEKNRNWPNNWKCFYFLLMFLYFRNTIIIHFITLRLFLPLCISLSRSILYYQYQYLSVPLSFSKDSVMFLFDSICMQQAGGVLKICSISMC